MKKLIFIGGAPGVGKTTVSKIVFAHTNRCAYLDGDACAQINPFVVTDEIKKLMMENITYVLTRHMECSFNDVVILSWVMHEDSIIDMLKKRIKCNEYCFFSYTLMCSEDTLIRRLQGDIATGVRTDDVIPRAVDRLRFTERMKSTVKIYTDSKTPEEVASCICDMAEL